MLSWRRVIAALTVLGSSILWNLPQVGAQAPALPSQEEILARGPIHEAFASPVGYDPVAGIVVPREPPADIEELPPEVSPDDPHAQWIGGYWHWDDERQDFIWISGVWRTPPPDQRWIPGYWTQVAGGFHRISGFWAPLEIQEVDYLPAPPASLEAGPNMPPPPGSYFWVPGNWVWTNGRYVWRGGYWAAAQQQWVWMPACYYWSPGGYIYSAGYWDYPLANRGMLFAPVYFPGNVYAQPNFRYSPSVLIAGSRLLLHLFVRPASGNYYFGDYYDPRYVGGGYYPWFAAGQNQGQGRGWYDPFYTYLGTQYGRNNPNWTQDLRRQFDYYTVNREARPRHTFAEQRQLTQQIGGGNASIQNSILAVSLSDAVKDRTLSTPTRSLSDAERRSFEQQSKVLKTFAKQQRHQLESHARADLTVGTQGRPVPGVQSRPGERIIPGGIPDSAAGRNVPDGRRASVEPNAAPKLKLPEAAANSIGRGTASASESTLPKDPASRADQTGRQVPGRPDRNVPERPDRHAPQPDATTAPMPTQPTPSGPVVNNPLPATPAPTNPAARTPNNRTGVRPGDPPNTSPGRRLDMPQTSGPVNPHTTDPRNVNPRNIDPRIVNPSNTKPGNVTPGNIPKLSNGNSGIVPPGRSDDSRSNPKSSLPETGAPRSVPGGSGHPKDLKPQPQGKEPPQPTTRVKEPKPPKVEKSAPPPPEAKPGDKPDEKEKKKKKD